LKVYNDIKTALPVDHPLLIFHSRKDRLIPDSKEHADISRSGLREKRV